MKNALNRFISILSSCIMFVSSVPFSNHALASAAASSAPYTDTQHTGYGISDVALADGKINVTFISQKACTVLVAFYNNDNTYMLASCSKSLSAPTGERETASIALPNGIPEFFTLRAMLLDEANVPLCNEFESNYYTEEITAVRQSNISDYDPNYTVSLGSAGSGGFVVLNSSVIIVRYDGVHNLIESFDDETQTYTISLPDSTLKNLKTGDAVYIQGVEGEESDLFEVAGFKMQNGNAVVKASFENAADYIDVMKVSEKLQNSKGSEDLPGIIVEEESEASEQSRLYSRPILSAPNPQSISNRFSHKFDLGRIESESEGASLAGFEVSGSVGGIVGVTYEETITHDSFISGGKKFSKTDDDVTFSLEVKADVNGKVKIPLGPGIHQSFLRGCYSLDIGPSGVLEGELSGGVQIETGYVFTTTTESSKPIFTPKKMKGDINATLEVFMGIEVGCEVKVKPIIELEGKIRAGINTTYDLHIQQPDDTHLCYRCYDITAETVFGLVFRFKLFGYEISYNPEKKYEFGRWYYSLSKNKGGKGECPYKASAVEYNVLDQYGRDLAGARIQVKRNNNTEDYFEYTGGSEKKQYPSIDELYKATAKLEKDGGKVLEGTASFTPPNNKNVKIVINVPEEPDPPTDDPEVINYVWYDAAGKRQESTYHDYPGIGKFVLFKDGHARVHEIYTNNVPEEIDGRTVTEMLDDAEINGMTSLNIPGVLVSLHNSWMKDLTEIDVYTGTDSIPNGWAYGSKLKSVSLPDGLESIGYQAFAGSSSLSSINIPDTVVSVGSSAFANCKSLTALRLPSSVENIGSACFSGCSALTSIDIPNQVTVLENETLKNCTNLKKVTLPDSVEVIGYNAFQNCTSLESIIIPASVTEIKGYAFAGCTNLKSVMILGSDVKLGDYAFYGCKSLETVNISGSVKEISNNCFDSCTELVSFELPDSVESIGMYAFSGCTKLKDFTLTDSGHENEVSIYHYAFKNCTSLTNAVLTDSVYELQNGVFSNCTSLESFTFPESVRHIGSDTFKNCTKLTSLTLPNFRPSYGFPVADETTSLKDIYYTGSMVEWNAYDYDMLFPYTMWDQYTVHCARGESNIRSVLPPYMEWYGETDVQEGSESTETYNYSYTVEDMDVEPKCSVTKKGNRITVSFNGAGKGMRYLLIASTKGGESPIAQEHLKYIMQKETDETGNVVFSFLDLGDDAKYMVICEKEYCVFQRFGSLPKPVAIESEINGDVNADGEFNVADVVLLQKWLLAVPDTHLADWEAANFCEDNRLDVFDLFLMKRALLAKNTTKWEVVDMGITKYNFISDTAIDVTVKETGEDTWWGQVYLPYAIEAGAAYEIQYTIKADANHLCNICIQRNSGDYETYYYNEMTATTKAQTVTERFTVEQDCPDAKIGFNLGYEPGFYQISNVKIVKIQ